MNTEQDIKIRRSIRLPGFNYAQPGAYFVTICTQQRECLLGEVIDGAVRLSEEGRAVEEEWRKTAEIRLNVELDSYVVMPNHFHGIIVLTAASLPGCATPAEQTTYPAERFGKPVAGSLPTIIRSFKSAATNRINEMRGTPGGVVWQRNYYEHVIRHEDDLARAREYIANNPSKWEFDRMSPDNAPDW